MFAPKPKSSSFQTSYEKDYMCSRDKVVFVFIINKIIVLFWTLLLVMAILFLRVTLNYFYVL